MDEVSGKKVNPVIGIHSVAVEIQSQIQEDAKKVGLSVSEYWVRLALEHEKTQINPSTDLNVVMVRFISHLIKTNSGRTDLIHHIQEVRKDLNLMDEKLERPRLNDRDIQIIKERLKSIFN